jgi:hypothetical protein
MKQKNTAAFFRENYCFIFFMCVTGIAGHAQVFMEYKPNAKGIDPSVLIYGSENFGNRIPYNKIAGSPFWKDEWQLAALYGDGKNDWWLMKTKLNLTTGEVYFINKGGEEQVAPDDVIKVIVFFKNFDTTQVDALFKYKYGETHLENKSKNNYIQIMNAGNYKLLKLDKRPLVSADSNFHTMKRYYFNPEVKYFLEYNNKTAIIKKLSRENICIYLPDAAACNAWINENKINFKKEEDIVRFLDYYNLKK